MFSSRLLNWSCVQSWVPENRNKELKDATKLCRAEGMGDNSLCCCCHYMGPFHLLPAMWSSSFKYIFFWQDCLLCGLVCQGSGCFFFFCLCNQKKCEQFIIITAMTGDTPNLASTKGHRINNALHISWMFFSHDRYPVIKQSKDCIILKCYLLLE